MDRRDFLKTTSGAAAAAAAGTTAVLGRSGGVAAPAIVSPAIVPGSKELRLALSWPDNGMGPADSARRLARTIEIATQMRYRFTFVAGEKRGIDAVQSGEADLYHGSEHDNLTHSRAFAYFAGLPGANGMRASAHESWMLAGGGQMLWDQLAAEHGVKGLMAGHTGRSAGLMSARTITTVAEFSGVRVWAFGLAGDVARGLGAEAVSLSAHDVERALSAGDIDAAEAGGAIASYAFGLLQHMPGDTGTSLNRSGTALSLGINKATWDAMSASDQAIFSGLATAELHATIAEEKAHRRQLLSARIMKPDRPGAHELASAVRRVSDAVVAHLAGSDANAARINASYAAFRAAIGVEPRYGAVGV